MAILVVVVEVSDTLTGVYGHCTKGYLTIDHNVLIL